MRLSPRLLRRLTAALMLSSALTLATASAEAANDPVGAFLSSQYTYCDAKLVAGLWKISIDDAKAEIGRKIEGGYAGNIAPILQQARDASLTCEWADVPHGYDDAERLARVWNMDSVEDAKAKIAWLYTQGDSASVLNALADNPAAVAPQVDDAALDAFYASAYTYCDAKLIGALWHIDMTQAKAEIGQKILNGYGDNLPQILSAARLEAQCDFSDTGLSYSDAEKLASVWGVPVVQAKDKAAHHYTQGNSAAVQAALAGPATPRPTPIVNTPGNQPPANGGK